MIGEGVGHQARDSQGSIDESKMLR
jgi:hypothetical protein